MKYFFKDIQSGQIGSGYTVIQITNNEAIIDAADTEAILLAEKNGGELVVKEPKSKPGPVPGLLWTEKEDK